MSDTMNISNAAGRLADQLNETGEWNLEFSRRCGYDEILTDIADVGGRGTMAVRYDEAARVWTTEPFNIDDYEIPITDREIEKLSDQAGMDGDLEQLAICSAALEGSETARRSCAELALTIKMASRRILALLG